MTSIDRAAGGLSIALLLALLIVVTLGATTRTAGDPLIWTDEAARFLMIWLAATGWFLASRKRGHIRVRYFVDKLGPASRRATEALLQAALVLFGMLLTWHGWDLIGRNLDVEATTLPVPMAVMYLPIVIVGVATAIQGGIELADAARGR